MVASVTFIALFVVFLLAYKINILAMTARIAKGVYSPSSHHSQRDKKEFAFSETSLAFNASHDCIQSAMTKGMSTVKMYNKN